MKSKVKKVDKKVDKKTDKKTDKKSAKKLTLKNPVKVLSKKMAPKKSVVALPKDTKKPKLKAEKLIPKKLTQKLKIKIKPEATLISAKPIKKDDSKKEVVLKTKLLSKMPAIEKLAPETSKKPKKSQENEDAIEPRLKKSGKKIVENVSEEVPVEAKREYSDEEVILTDAEGRRYCRVKECDQISSVDAYCRYHYLLFWKKIQVRKKILTEGKLERYVEELTARYPDKYLEMLRKDLRSEKDFVNAIQELELDDTSGENDLEDEAQSYIEEVRGMSSEGGSTRDDDEF